MLSRPEKPILTLPFLNGRGKLGGSAAEGSRSEWRRYRAAQRLDWILLTTLAPLALVCLGLHSYAAATDDEALDAVVYVSRKEGIIPAFEPAHASAELRKRAASYDEETLVIGNLCGRGDKDVA